MHLGTPYKKNAALIWVFFIRGGGEFRANPKVLGPFFVPQQFWTFVSTFYRQDDAQHIFGFDIAL